MELQLGVLIIAASIPHSSFLDISLPFSTLWTPFGRTGNKKRKTYYLRVSLTVSPMPSHIFNIHSDPWRSFKLFSLSQTILSHFSKNILHSKVSVITEEKKKSAAAGEEASTTLPGTFPSLAMWFHCSLFWALCSVPFEQVNWVSSNFATFAVQSPRLLKLPLQNPID